MTLPFERTRAMLDVRLFLLELTDQALTPRVPRAMRGRAASLVKHFPTNADIEQAHQALPDCFGAVPPFRTRAELAAELAVELTPTSKPLKEVDNRVEVGSGRDMPGVQTDEAPALTGNKNGD